jgi:hypothetical protein
VSPERLCDLCGERPADLKYREVTGWEEVRSQGGANKIIARQVTDRRGCDVCIGRLRWGVPVDQETML